MIIIIIWFSCNECYTDNLNNIKIIKLLKIRRIQFENVKFKEENPELYEPICSWVYIDGNL